MWNILFAIVAVIFIMVKTGLTLFQLILFFVGIISLFKIFEFSKGFFTNDKNQLRNLINPKYDDKNIRDISTFDAKKKKLSNKDKYYQITKDLTNALKQAVQGDKGRYFWNNTFNGVPISAWVDGNLTSFLIQIGTIQYEYSLDFNNNVFKFTETTYESSGSLKFTNLNTFDAKVEIIMLDTLNQSLEFLLKKIDGDKKQIETDKEKHSNLINSLITDIQREASKQVISTNKENKDILIEQTILEEDYKPQIDSFKETILSQSNEIQELQNKLITKEQDTKDLVDNLVSKIEAHENKYDVQNKFIKSINSEIEHLKTETRNSVENNQIEELKLQAKVFQSTLTYQSDKIIELQNQLITKEQKTKTLVDSFMSKINKLEEKIAKQKVVKTKIPLNIPTEKQSIKKDDGVIVKRESFDDF